MHHFHLTDEEREYWMGVAISRDELERGEADESDATYWTGQTLSEMQSVARAPMALATDAIKDLLTSLRPGDQVSVIAFADRVHSVFNQQDWANFPDGCLAQMDLLRDRRLPVDIGTGTHMAEALRQASASLTQNALSRGVNRLIVLSDGIVQDAEATLRVISEIQAHGYAITTIGLGEEFDEEFLTRVADNSRGEYYYAADSVEITQRLSQEMTTLQTTTITDLYIAVRPQFRRVFRQRFGDIQHARIITNPGLYGNPRTARPMLYPADKGRHVRCGSRQSIPSSNIAN